VRANIDQSPVGMLAMDLGKRHGDLPQQVEADGLIVDGGAAGAIGILDAADDQLALRIDPLILQNGEGEVIARQGKGRRHDAAFRAGPHQAGIATRAKCQPERIEQDRLACAGFAGQHGEALVERDVELLDEDDVANGKCGQHALNIRSRRPRRKGRSERVH